MDRRPLRLSIMAAQNCDEVLLKLAESLFAKT